TFCTVHRTTLRAKMLAVLFVLGGFASLINAEFPARVPNSADGVITGLFPNSLLLTLPPCKEYAGENVDLEYINADTNENKTLEHIFIVASCNASSIGFYHLLNLTKNTEYRLRYKVGTDNSSLILAHTRNVSDYNDIDSGLPGRSGAMVVITVILSLAMFFLLVCLILSTVLSTSGN
ncbi:hypothetical protein NFI96_029143, partial [Prochilodus magdalenae]